MKNRMIENAFWNTTYKVLNIFMPLIFSVYSSQIFLAEGVGRIAFAQNIETYFVTIAALGIPNYGTKKIGSVQNIKEKRDTIFTELFCINFISTIICTISYYILINAIITFKGNYLLVIFGSVIFFNCFNIDWLYQGIEKYKYIAIRSTVIKIISIVLLFIFVHEAKDIYIYTGILCFSIVGNYIFNIVHSKKYVRLKFDNLNIKQHLKPVFILLASTCATEIYTLLDSTMVGILRGDAELGYYTNASKTIRIIFSLIMAICAVYLPRLSLMYREKKMDHFKELASQGLKVALYVSIPAFIGIFLISDDIIQLLYGISFLPAITTLRILSGLVLVFSVAYMAGHVILIATNKESIILKAAIVGAIINFSLNNILIRIIGYNGAAISSVIAEIVVTLVLVHKTKKSGYFKIDYYFIKSVIYPTFLMIFSIILIRFFIGSLFVETLLSVVIGIIIYFISTIIIKNEIATSFYKVLKNYLKIFINRSKK